MTAIAEMEQPLDLPKNALLGVPKTFILPCAQLI